MIKLRARSLSSLENDEIAFGAVQHFLTIGIETILDIGSHILTEDFGASPETYEEVLILLGKKKVINKKLTQESKGMGQFRNKMIHEYADIDPKKVYVFLRTAPDIFKQYDAAFSNYLIKNRLRKSKRRQ